MGRQVSVVRGLLLRLELVCLYKYVFSFTWPYLVLSVSNLSLAEVQSLSLRRNVAFLMQLAMSHSKLKTFFQFTPSNVIDKCRLLLKPTWFNARKIQLGIEIACSSLCFCTYCSTSTTLLGWPIAPCSLCSALVLSFLLVLIWEEHRANRSDKGCKTFLG